MKKAFFIYTSDEDGCVGFKCALEIPESIHTYEDAINHLHPILASPEFVKDLIEGDALDDDLFMGHKFKLTYCGYRNYNLEYEFQYCGDEEIDEDELYPTQIHYKDMDFITIW